MKENLNCLLSQIFKDVLKSWETTKEQHHTQHTQKCNVSNSSVTGSRKSRNSMLHYRPMTKKKEKPALYYAGRTENQHLTPALLGQGQFTIPWRKKQP